MEEPILVSGDAAQASEHSAATPQAADLGLHAAVGSSSFSGAESAFDAANATADLNKAPVHEPVLHAAGCACAACSGRSADSTGGSGAGSGDGVSAASLGTLDQLADYLETQFWTDFSGANSNRNFNLSDTGTYAKDGDLTYNTSGNSQDSDGLSSGRADLVDEAFKLFEAILGIDFQKTSASGADFRFGDSDSGAYASASRSGSTTQYSEINVTSSWYSGSTSLGDYAFQTILHEIGHGLGLGHQGHYNGSGSYSTDADFTNDSWQVAMMSYFSQTENTSIDASYAFLSTPMVVDWIALDDLYGAQGYGISNAFVGDTTYGFNTTISASTSKVFNELKDWIPSTAFTVVDGGGADTLDFSGFSSTQLIDLRPSDESATNVYPSNIGGKTGNLTFAPGTLIETAIGGSGADTFRGNSANNSFDGGGGTDAVLYGGAVSDYRLSLSGSSLQITDLRSGSPDGADMLTNIESVNFNGDTRSWATLLGLVDTTAPSISGPSGTAGDATSAISVNENTTSVTTFSANESVTWSLSGGADQARFSINSSNGALVFASAPDYESPQDSGSDNSYVVSVRATDASSNTSDQTVTVSVQDADETAPSISGPSGTAGDATSAISVNENTTSVTTFSANESVTWSLSGGADQARFSINSSNGALVFASAPDYESPQDSGSDNSYVVSVRATDASSNTSDQTVTVSVQDADETAPSISGPSGTAGDATSAISVNENTTSVTTFSANESVTWSLSGGADQARFSINSSNGALVFASAPDYESPQDSGSDNSYVVSVRATDASSNTSDQTVTVSVQDADETAPSISGPSGTAGDATSAISVNENTTSVTTFSANESVTWSLSGGADQARFSINSSNGALVFASAPDYESPQDSGSDNSYVVSVRATDASSNTSDQTVTVSVQDADETAPSPTPAPSPAPSPTPAPSPAPSPTPAPSPAPSPTPAPSPAPSPTPAPSPAPSPTPAPSPAPSPTPAPSPAPSPTPAPSPAPSPTPAPSPAPSPTPAPSPAPSPTPAPSPAPDQSPIEYGVAETPNRIVEVPTTELENISVNTVDQTTTVTADSAVKNMAIEITNDFFVEGKKLSQPIFTLNNKVNSALTLSNTKTVNASINAEKGNNTIAFADTTLKSSVVNGGKGKELIEVEEGTKLIGKNTFNLGDGRDTVAIKGTVKTLVINNGIDNKKDATTIESYDLIKKKLTINNFSKKDKLIIEGDVFKYKSLKNNEINNSLEELGIFVDIIGNKQSNNHLT